MIPKISVLMSTFNGATTIDRAIESVLLQTYSNFEFIICNDGSTDTTLKHLNMWARKDNRIKIINNEHNCGLQISLNKCINRSSGPYIARMDDDDISLPNRFKIQLHFLENNPNITFVGSNVFMFDSKDGIYGQSNFLEHPNGYQVFKRDPFCHPSIFIRANILRHVGSYSIKKRYLRIEDHELWLRLYSLGYKGANIKQPLLDYHFDIHSSSSKFYDYYNRFRLLKVYRPKLHIGIKGYVYILLPLIKLMVPSMIRDIVYSHKYNAKGKGKLN